MLRESVTGAAFTAAAWSWWLALAIGLVDVHGRTMDLIDDCCRQKCGRIEQPLLINSDGLDKTDEQMSELQITSIGRSFDENAERQHELYCSINIYTLDYVMLNLSYFLESRQDGNTVVVSMPVSFSESCRKPAQFAKLSEMIDDERMRTQRIFAIESLISSVVGGALALARP